MNGVFPSCARASSRAPRASKIAQTSRLPFSAACVSMRQHTSAYVRIRPDSDAAARTHARTHARTRPRHSSVCYDSDKDIAPSASRVPTRLEASRSPRTHTHPSHSQTSRLLSTSLSLGISTKNEPVGAKNDPVISLGRFSMFQSIQIAQKNICCSLSIPYLLIFFFNVGGRRRHNGSQLTVLDPDLRTSFSTMNGLYN